MSWEKIDESTYQYDEGGVRFFLLMGKKEALLIDSGMQTHNAKELVKELTDLPVRLFNTHTDVDHVGSNEEFDEVMIVPEELYTKADINYMNPLSRCNKEQIGKKDVPVKGKVQDFDKYDTVYVGFPIWYAAAPRVVYTFCKGYNWEGKKVYAFATSGGSGIGKTAERLEEYVKGAASVEAKLIHSADEIVNW